MPDRSSMRTARFAGLDGLRGLAALCVMLFHYRLFFSSSGLLHHAYLAVDFFFMLSGFVIAHAYEDRMVGGFSWLKFMRLRLIRLMPLIVMGVLAGAAYFGVREHFEPGRATPAYIMLAWVFGVLLLPMSLISGEDAYPLDGPTWSLFFELLANAVWAVIGFRLSNRMLVSTLLFAVIALGALASLDRWHGIGGEFPMDGFARAGFSFFMGTALYRWRTHGRLRWVPSLSPLPAGALLLVTFLPPEQWPQTYNLAVTALVYPLLIISSAKHQTGGRTARLCALAGWLSYPLYILHEPVLAWATGTLKMLHLFDSGTWTGYAYATLSILAAAAAGYFYDDPIRRWLSRRSGTTAREIAIAEPTPHTGI